jgi:hypothetical protein
MKLLTTIALFCFSVTANADIFVCQAKEIVTSGSDLGKGFFYSPSEIIESAPKTVDTDKGFSPASNGNYIGTCVIKNVTDWSCEATLKYRNFMIRLTDGSRSDAPIVFSAVTLGPNYYNASKGVCTKI